MITPKGLKYWIIDKTGQYKISPNAPQWAKDEFLTYQSLMNENKDEIEY